MKEIFGKVYVPNMITTSLATIDDAKEIIKKRYLGNPSNYDALKL